MAGDRQRGDAIGSLLGPSHTAAFSLLRLLATATAARLGRAATRRIELIRAIHEELEDLEA